MKSPAFEYVRAESVADAMSAYAEADGDAVYLSGGHSVVPSLALRLQAPALLIDLSNIAALSGISLHDGWLRIGAMTRHVQALKDPLIAAHAPLFTAAAPFVAHPAIRNRGTLGGSLAHADPASEFPAAAVAMRAELEIASSQGIRRVPADDFFVDIYETAIEPGEVLQAIHVPSPVAGQVIGFDEIARRRGDYAMVGAAVQAVSRGSGLEDVSIALFSVGNHPVRARKAQAALTGRMIDADAIADAQAALEDDLDPPDDPQFPASMRLHLARVLLGRVLANLEAVA
ncbi:FAD binding domain-containing protein [Antarcticimicrobium sediminis]|uniref:Xanthine dehydrogenase family protein subunit M n=1 Tax=Antarcticimicrobium sediminis TaxID=2546227 RepID=A0A4R5ET53_9RHOB|nr:FAD binding domain-containing protein [Antarcticimicrobium sediminis]TDE37954.1 xanthine dehydrogenase family protein subunit M [Antarcticimicrobium sediminis]